MIKIGGINYGSVFCATGARGFYGEGFPFHRIWKHFGMDWSGTAFSGKTLTLPPKVGFMPLRKDGTTPQEWFPRCIWGSFRNGGELINAVGLSNLGAQFYLNSGHYHRLSEPFSISFMCQAEDAAGRKAEIAEFCRRMKAMMPFNAPVMLQINFGCPNSGHDLTTFYQEICQLVNIAKSILGIPVFINTNALMPIAVFRKVERDSEVDGFWIGNTILFNAPETKGMIDWSRFGPESPLRKRGINADGGLSSHDCLRFTLETVRRIRDDGIKIPIVAGNGIRTCADVAAVKKAGGDAIFIGSLGIVRPYRMQSVIKYAHAVFD